MYYRTKYSSYRVSSPAESAFAYNIFDLGPIDFLSSSKNIEIIDAFYSQRYYYVLGGKKTDRFGGLPALLGWASYQFPSTHEHGHDRRPRKRGSVPAPCEEQPTRHNSTRLQGGRGGQNAQKVGIPGGRANRDSIVTLILTGN